MSRVLEEALGRLEKLIGMKIAALQHDIHWQDPAATHQRLMPLIEQAAAAGARVVVLTEMYATGFVTETAEHIAEKVGGPSEQFLIDTAKRCGIWLIASVPQRCRNGEQPQNVGLVVSPEGSVSRYAKLHPFSYFGEHKYYASGDHTLTVPIDDLSVTLFICYDLRFANQFWELAPRTDCYVVVANWPEPRRQHWQTLLCARAIENQAYVVGVNRVGVDPAGNKYAGDSQIIDPNGRILTHASWCETVLIAEVDPAEVREARRKFPVIADRRNIAVSAEIR